VVGHGRLPGQEVLGTAELSWRPDRRRMAVVQVVEAAVMERGHAGFIDARWARFPSEQNQVKVGFQQSQSLPRSLPVRVELAPCVRTHWHGMLRKDMAKCSRPILSRVYAKSGERQVAFAGAPNSVGRRTPSAMKAALRDQSANHPGEGGRPFQGLGLESSPGCGYLVAAHLELTGREVAPPRYRRRT
jgi:hypothetical protein